MIDINIPVEKLTFNGQVMKLVTGPPPITTGGLFTGATIPLTYKDNTHEKENNYEYKSANYNITITGLDGRATITGNGTKEVLVVFDVTSATSSLQEFLITLTSDTETVEYKGLHAHYGSTVTGILTLAYTNIPPTGTGTIGVEYMFIEDSELPYFPYGPTLYNGIYSYQLLNVLIGNHSGSIDGSFLQHCYSFNQPLDLSNVTSISYEFLQNCYSFNQPLDLSNVTNTSFNFLYGCHSFNQPLDISNVTSIGHSFLSQCHSFNQPLDLSNVTNIDTNFLSQCYSFNQPLDLSNVTSIGDSFLMKCYSFNQPLEIPISLSSIGSNNFINSCYSLSTIIWNAEVFPTSDRALGQGVNTKTSTDGAGIKVYGTNRAGLLTALPDRTSSPYRKLIDGGEI